MSLNHLVGAQTPLIDGKVNNLTVVGTLNAGAITVGGFTPNEVAVSDSGGDLTTIPTLPISNGGTNSSTALTNDKFMVSSSGKIQEGTSVTNPSIQSSGTSPILTLTNTSSTAVSLLGGIAILAPSIPNLSKVGIEIGTEQKQDLCGQIIWYPSGGASSQIRIQVRGTSAWADNTGLGVNTLGQVICYSASDASGTLTASLVSLGGAEISKNIYAGGISAPQVVASDITGTSYTLLAGDANKLLYTTNGSTTTITVPAESTTSLPIGTEYTIVQYGAGQVVFSPAIGVTITSAGSLLKIGQQYTSAIIKKRATDEWFLNGNLSA